MAWEQTVATPDASIGNHWWPGIWIKKDTGWSQIDWVGSTAATIAIYVKTSSAWWTAGIWDQEYPGAVDIPIDVYVKK